MVFLSLGKSAVVYSSFLPCQVLQSHNTVLFLVLSNLLHMNQIQSSLLFYLGEFHCYFSKIVYSSSSYTVKSIIYFSLFGGILYHIFCNLFFRFRKFLYSFLEPTDYFHSYNSSASADTLTIHIPFVNLTPELCHRICIPQDSSWNPTLRHR